MLFIFQSCLCEIKWLPKLINSFPFQFLCLNSLTKDDLLTTYLLREYSRDTDVALVLQSRGGGGGVHKHFFDRDARPRTNFNYPKK